MDVHTRLEAGLEAVAKQLGAASLYERCGEDSSSFKCGKRNKDTAYCMQVPANLIAKTGREPSNGLHN